MSARKPEPLQAIEEMPAFVALAEKLGLDQGDCEVKPLAALLLLALLCAIAWTDGWVKGQAVEQTPVAAVEESGHRRVRCE